MKTVYIIFTYPNPDDTQGDMVSLGFADKAKAENFIRARAVGLIQFFQSPECLIEFSHSPQGEFVDHWSGDIDPTGKYVYHFTTSPHVPKDSNGVSDWQHIWGKMALYPLAFEE